MRPAEVLAIELEQYAATDGTRMIVPKLVGQTERARSTKAVAGGAEPITVEEWLERFAERNGTDAWRGAERALDMFWEMGCSIIVARTKDSVSAAVTCHYGKRTFPFAVRLSNGSIELSLWHLSGQAPFETKQARHNLLMRMKALPGVVVRTQKLIGLPSFPAAKLLEDTLWTRYRELVEEVITRLRETGSSTEGSSNLEIVDRAAGLPAA